MSLIVLKNIKKEYGKNQVLFNDLSLEIEPLILFDVAFDAHPSFLAFKMWRLTHILHFKKFFYCKPKRQGV